MKYCRVVVVVLLFIVASSNAEEGEGTPCGEFLCDHGVCDESDTPSCICDYYWFGSNCNVPFREHYGKELWLTFASLVLLFSSINLILSGALMITFWVRENKELAKVQQLGVYLLFFGYTLRFIFGVALVNTTEMVYFSLGFGIMFPVIVSILCIQVILWYEFYYSLAKEAMNMNWKRVYILTTVILIVAFLLELLIYIIRLLRRHASVVTIIYSIYLIGISIGVIIAFWTSRILVRKRIKELRKRSKNVVGGVSRRKFALITWLTCGMTITLLGVIVAVILYEVTANVPVGRITTSILARILEFALSMMFLFSVGASSFKQIITMLMPKSTSSTETTEKVTTSNSNFSNPKSNPTNDETELELSVNKT